MSEILTALDAESDPNKLKSTEVQPVTDTQVPVSPPLIAAETVFFKPKTEEKPVKKDNRGILSSLMGCATAAIKILAYEYRCYGIDTEEKEEDKKKNPHP